MDVQEMSLRLHGLVVLRGLLSDAVIEKYAAMLASAASGKEAFITSAAEFEAALFDTGRCWTDYLLDAVLENDNICIRRAASGGAPQAAEEALSSRACLSPAGGLHRAG